ncbi:MAG: type II toxin-antitoxin system RelE/ParE family toxin [Bacteroidetes bacterium]|nr:type II toxin-antitoxin system RelE/ParE family toxin [Bacteroidota bacterium]
MEIQFKNNTLKKQYQSHAEAFSAYGKQVGKKYIGRINIIKRSRNIDELTAVRALKCHPLKGNRKGEWAVKLTGFARLIFTLKGENLEIARIEEVSKHYDD